MFATLPSVEVLCCFQRIVLGALFSIEIEIERNGMFFLSYSLISVPLDRKLELKQVEVDGKQHSRLFISFFINNCSFNW